MTTIVACSDLHLDTRTDGVRRFPEVENALWQAAREAVKRRADLFCMLGDLGDPDSGGVVYPLLALVVRVMGFLAAEGVPQVWVKGNHDGPVGQSLFTPLAAYSESCGFVNAYVFEEPGDWLLREDFDVLALPHGQYDADAIVRKFTAERKPWRKRGSPSVVLSHLYPIEGLEFGEESEEFARGGPNPLPLDALSELGEGVVVLQGHFHKRQTYQPPVGPLIHVVGSLVQLSHSEEANDPGFLIITF